MANLTEIRSIAASIAALSICESLLLAMSDLKIMSEKDIDGVLQDAAAANRNAGTSPQAKALHREVVNIIQRIAGGGDAVPRP